MARLATALALCAGARAYVAPVAPKATVARGAFYGGGESGALDNLEGAPPGPVPNVANPGGAWDPLNLADTTEFGPTLEWYRAAELKHCRVAMAAFVGFWWPARARRGRATSRRACPGSPVWGRRRSTRGTTCPCTASTRSSRGSASWRSPARWSGRTT